MGAAAADGIVMQPPVEELAARGMNGTNTEPAAMKILSCSFLSATALAAPPRLRP